MADPADLRRADVYGYSCADSCGEGGAALPVGAVVVRRGILVAEAHNLTRTLSDPTAHAEVIALRRAALRLGDWRLPETTLYVTLEPCAMCAGAVLLGRVPRVVYGTPDPKSGMAGSLGNLLQDPRLNQ